MKKPKILIIIFGALAIILLVVLLVLTTSPAIDPTILTFVPDSERKLFSSYLEDYTKSANISSLKYQEDSLDTYTSEEGTTITFIANSKSKSSENSPSLIITYSYDSDLIDAPFNVYCLPDESCPSTGSENNPKTISFYNSSYLLSRGLTKSEYLDILSFVTDYFSENSPLTYRVVLDKSSFHHNKITYYADLITETGESYLLEYNRETKTPKISL